ncbi:MULTISPECIES: ExbD/TolR family protein [Flagellimonas]|uniref:Biopolymer transporter ExbD n=1 Tax=Flagellimonas hadalis TaxID=2597517 RepID=A0A5N5J4L8_9FLAO|nr:biopolymer transporter ExbD [Allomuricauda hadalis]KAB5490160.1 biopolymer transporter ExbD [Allomuricauda hadalis]
MGRTRENPEVHAGSMADIAFLLLIFFLVTTTIQTDVGLDRKLPSDDVINHINVNERNVLRISLNKNDELFVEDRVLKIDELKRLAVAFLDNGGATENQLRCDYCKGARDPKSSDNPQKAIISLSSDRDASYGTYVQVQDRLALAYRELRNREAQRLFGQDFTVMEEKFYAAETKETEKATLKANIERIREMFPLNITEAELNVQSQKLAQ